MKNLERSLSLLLVVLIGMVIVESAKIPMLSQTEIASALQNANRSPAVVR
jgi:hypothetical protein